MRLTNTRDWTVDADGTPIARLIADSWDRIAELEEAGALSEAQVRHLYRRDDEMPDTPIGRRLMLTMLRRAIEDPRQVGVNPEALARFSCPCGDTGMVANDAGAYRPCDRCNPGGYAMWRDCYLTGCRGCERCRPSARRRGMAGDHRGELAEDRAEAARRSILDDLA